MKINYCIRCVIPSTKPDIFFDSEGLCSGCKSFESRRSVDWTEREKEFIELADRYRSPSGQWDCVIGVSGGKDSLYQVLRAKEYGLNPLCVTSTTCDFSEIGKRNLTAIRELGVDHIQFSANPVVRRKLNRIGLEQVGDIAWPEHVGIFTVPVRVALQYGIKLIIWGENSQNEYGGPEAAAASKNLDRSWLEEFGGLLGMRTGDLVDVFGFLPSEVHAYEYPPAETLEQAGITGVFLGHYFPWDGLSNNLVATAYGFENYGMALEGSYLNFENLDNHHHGIHDYFKFLKYGFGRTTDQVCLQIRRGRMNRDQGLEVVRMRDGRFPWSYLGKNINEILDPLQLGIEEFVSICDQFTNHELFQKNSDGSFMKDSKQNLKLIEPVR